MKLLSLFTFALLSFVKTSPPDIHSREVSSVENGRSGIVSCNRRFIQCSGKFICEAIDESGWKVSYGRLTTTFLCDSEDPYNNPRRHSPVKYNKFNIRFISCTPLTGNIKETPIDLTENISKYYIDDGKNYVTANNKEYVCASRYNDEVIQISRSLCSGNRVTPVCP
ncbi:hypothetical protein PPACK8108_LOCUS5355 [Phakopsora pachyrhizi]|uniref:Uncharacterized protein n=1 Tax=Phakopsora pachyrhizi TaxID=170000 RepID=A0AAV0ANS1_PHAPC|nr:hypothetical protein PPACK8108_LOCUS5355 [Phakopsora pachyrhizi]